VKVSCKSWDCRPRRSQDGTDSSPVLVAMNDSSATQPLDKISIGGYAEFDVRHSTLIAEYVDSTDAYVR